MSHFILMLTKDDCTVRNALEVYEEIHDTGVEYVGFKDIGLPLDDMKSLVSRMRQDGRRVMLEVVSTTREDEIRSVRAAIEIGVDYLLGGRHVADVLPLLAGTTMRYFPFCGNTVGHPTRLEGTIGEIVEDAYRLSLLPGVHGLDLLAYRFAGDVEELTRRVVAAVDVPVIAAGSIDCSERVQTVCDAGAWGFTIGSALFERKFIGTAVKQQVQSVIHILSNCSANWSSVPP
jgi:hypothetical protein